VSKSRKHTEITIETETLVIFRSTTNSLRAWCERCETESLLLTPGAAARLCGVTTSVIYARVAAGAVHYTELSDGTLFICGLCFGLNQP